jgi:hypothetical protein
MKILLMLLMLLKVTATVSPVFGEEKDYRDYKGLWGCETTKDFGYQSGKIHNFEKTKFFAKVTEKTVIISGDTIGESTIMIMQDRMAKSELIGYGFMTFFKLHNGVFAMTSMHLHGSEPATFTHIGTCERFDA